MTGQATALRLVSGEGRALRARRQGLGALVMLGFVVFSAAPVAAQPAGDANCDGRIDLADLPALTLLIFDATASCEWADVNGDGRVSVADISALVPLLVPSPPTPTGSPATPIDTLTATGTPVSTATATLVGTPATRTRTATHTKTPTRTLRPTATRTGTRTLRATQAPTGTRTRPPTRGPTNTRTVTLTPTVTQTPLPRPFGPEITFFGLARGNNTLVPPVGEEDGVPIFDWPQPIGFLIVVEGYPGESGRPLGTGGTQDVQGGVNPVFPPFNRASIQLLADNPLGNGSEVVCDIGPPPDIGGVPVTVPPQDFRDEPEVTDAINDMACRFFGLTSSPFACTLGADGDSSFIDPRTTLQYCTAPAVGTAIAFPRGRTRITVQLMDVTGNIGDRRSLIVNILEIP